MSDLERKEIFIQVVEQLDNIDEILEDNEVDPDGDEQFAEMADLLGQIRTLIESGE